jgi:hypothetical protein
MAELAVNEIGMNFHSIYFSHLGHKIHLFYVAKFLQVNEIKFHFIKE